MNAAPDANANTPTDPSKRARPVWHRVLTGLVALAVLMPLAACGGGDSDADTGSVDIGSVDIGSVDTDRDAEGAVESDGNRNRFDGGDEESALVEESPSDDRAFGDTDATTADRAAASTAENRRQTAGGMAEDAAASTEGGFFAPESPPTPAPTDGANDFADYGVRSFIATDRDPVSTFALDVDTGSYTVARRLLDEGRLPSPESVRVEEFVNRFRYDYPAPRRGLGVVADGGPSPFDPNNVIVRLGVQAARVDGRRPSASLTFVIDTSGSMDRPDRLELVKRSLAGLTRQLDDDDSVAIVTYSDTGTVILEPTDVADADAIVDAIDRLQPTGSTNLEAGLAAGYDQANRQYRRGGINRVVLASDGIANVGLVDPDRLSTMIRDDADEGIQLVTVGVGMDSFNDQMMEQLADRGDGFYAYIDDIDEARRLFGTQLTSTLVTTAIDGKIQVEFNPDTVAEYRLIGFENRAVLDRDFRNDEVDAGELGADHQVTALYELTLRPGVGDRDRLGTAYLRWEDPDDREVRETELDLDARLVEDRWADTSDDFRLAVTVGSFAEVLRNSPYRGDVDLGQIQAEAEALADTRWNDGDDLFNFVDMVATARRIS